MKNLPDNILRKNTEHFQCRRSGDRRVSSERRTDPRSDDSKKRSLITWVRSLTSPRLGVDRRKGNDPRTTPSLSKDIRLHSLLSQDEIEDLLK